MPLKVSSFGTQVWWLREAAAQKCAQTQCEEAIGLLEEAVRMQSGNAELYYQLGFCHSGGCRRHMLVNPEMAVEYLNHALSLVGTSAESIMRAKILDGLGNTLVESSRGPPTDRLREAIACLQEAAEIYRSKDLLDEWAREEFNQANVLCDLAALELPEKWAQAIEHYENALRVRTEAKDPRRYAATVMNLGTALRQSPVGDKAANVLKAIRCYREALRIYTMDVSPAQYANLCNNLGNACLSYPARDEPAKKRHARDAIRHFEQVLQVWSAEENGCQYALVQYNRGCAYLRLAASSEDFARAAACLSEACVCSLSCGRPEIAALARARLENIVFPLNGLVQSDP
jgi:hypothetical protein